MSGASMPSGYEYARELFPLYTCTEERDTCDLSAPEAGDADAAANAAFAHTESSRLDLLNLLEQTQAASAH